MRAPLGSGRALLGFDHVPPNFDRASPSFDRTPPEFDRAPWYQLQGFNPTPPGPEQTPPSVNCALGFDRTPLGYDHVPPPFEREASHPHDPFGHDHETTQPLFSVADIWETGESKFDKRNSSLEDYEMDQVEVIGFVKNH